MPKQHFMFRHANFDFYSKFMGTGTVWHTSIQVRRGEERMTFISKV